MRKPFRISPLSLFETSLWPRGRRRTDFEAFHDLLRRASYHNTTVRIHGREVMLRPNQVLCSSANLAKDWGWHRSTVLDFLHRLAADGLAVIDTGNRVTILTLYPDGDAPTENSHLEEPEPPRNSQAPRRSADHSTDRPPAHSKNKDLSSNSYLRNSKKEFLECAPPFAGEEFTEFLRSKLSGPDRLPLTPDLLPRIRAAWLEKLVAEGRLNGEEKDRILLSSNGV